MTYRLTIKGRLPGLNEYIDACRSNSRAGNRAKRNAQDIVCLSITQCRLRGKKIHCPVHLSYKFYEQNKRRDQDNVSSFARKVIQDGLVQMGVLPDDGWDEIAGSDEVFAVDKGNPRIEVEIQEVEPND